MKWFNPDYKPPETEEEEALLCIQYLSKGGKRPERYKTFIRLRKLILKRILSDNTLIEAAKLGYTRISTAVATVASRPVCDFLLQNPKLMDQEVIACMIYNKNITDKDLQLLYNLCDRTKRGKANKNIIASRLGYKNEYIGTYVQISGKVDFEYEEDEVFLVIDNPFVHMETIDIKSLKDGAIIRQVPVDKVKRADIKNLLKLKKNEVLAP